MEQGNGILIICIWSFFSSVQTIFSACKDTVFHNLDMFQSEREIDYLPKESGVIESVWEMWGNREMVSSLDPKEVKVFPEKYIPCKSFSDPTLRTCHEMLSPKHISSPGRFPYMYPFMAIRHLWQRKEYLIYCNLASLETQWRTNHKAAHSCKNLKIELNPFLEWKLMPKRQLLVQCH